MAAMSPTGFVNYSAPKRKCVTCKVIVILGLSIGLLTVAGITLNPTIIHQLPSLSTDLANKTHVFIESLSQSAGYLYNDTTSTLIDFCSTWISVLNEKIAPFRGTPSSGHRTNAQIDVCYKETWRDVFLNSVQQENFQLWEKLDDFLTWLKQFLDERVTVKEAIIFIGIYSVVLFLITYVISNNGSKENALFNRQLSDLNFENHQLKLEKNSQSEVEYELKKQVTTLINERISAERASEEANRTVAQLQANQREIEAWKESVEQSINQYYNEIQLKYNENESLKVEVESLQLKCNEFETKVKELNAEIELLRNTNKNQGTKSSLDGAEITKLKRENENLLVEKCKFKSHTQQLVNEIGKLRSELEKMRNNHKVYVESLKQQHGDNPAVRNIVSMERANETIFRLNEEVKLLRDERSSLKNRLVEAQSKIETAIKEKHEAVIRLQTTTKYYEEELANLKKKTIERKEESIPNSKPQANIRKAERTRWSSGPANSPAALPPPPLPSTRRVHEDRWFGVPLPISPPAALPPPPLPEYWYQWSPSTPPLPRPEPYFTFNLAPPPSPRRRRRTPSSKNQ